MIDLSHYTTATFVPAVEAALADPAYVLTVPAAHLLALAPQEQFDRFIARKYQKGPKVHRYLVDVATSFASPTMALAKKAIEFNMDRYQEAQLRRAASLYPHVMIERVFLTLTERDRALLPAVARLVAQSVYTPDQWSRFIALFAWNGGKSALRPSPAYARDKDMPYAIAELTDIFKHLFPDNDTYLADAARDVARLLKSTPVGVPGMAADALSTGARWGTAADVQNSAIYSTKRTPQSVFLGLLPETREPLFFNGNESLVTFGGPGTGKSSALVIPNLLTYPGSAIVLDVKGELYEATAAYRRAHFGPVYRFAPTDPSGQTHRFNPFDFVSDYPLEAATDCEVFAHQIIIERADDKDPYWEGKGRDYLWAFAFLTATLGDPSQRTIEQLTRFLSLPTSLTDETDRSTADPETLAVIQLMRDAAAHFGIVELENTANAFYDGLGSNRLDSVLDAARRHLSTFARSPLIRHALATSDWSPEDLRTHPGTTVYICIEDPKTFGAVVRLMLFQHFRILRQHVAKPGEPPITFFLDEMPRLGNFTSILEMQDIGRSAGLRLWMFAQSYGQLVQNFGKARAPGIVDSCRVRTFLEPQHDEAKLILPALGKRRNIFTGEERPLATEDQLAGQDFARKIVLTTRGGRPFVLHPKYAHTSPSLRKRITPPPALAHGVNP